MAKKKIPNIIKQVQIYKPPPINWDIDKIISHTQLSKYNSCAYQWQLRHRDKHKFDKPSINLIFGTSIHDALQRYISVYYNESKAAADRLNIEVIFKDNLRRLYLEEYKKQKNNHFSTLEEMNEFFEDGIEIIKFFLKNVGSYFSKKGWWLVGCEIPVNHLVRPNVWFNGSLDIVLYHESTNTIKIYDLKTSTKSWSKNHQQKDEVKIAQILLYKKLFSKQFDFPVDNIEVEFLILKRKLYDNCDFQQKRIQEFKPASGKIKLNKASLLLENFVSSVFDDNGEFRKITFKKTISKYSCQWCPFQEMDELCDKNKPNLKWRNPFDIV